MNGTIVASLLSLLSIIVAVATFLLDRKRTKKVETIKKLNEIFDRYYDLRGLDLNDDYKEFCAFTSDFSRFAYAVNERVYDEKVVIEKASRLLESIYESFLKDVIEKHRVQFKDDTYYQEIDTLMKKIRRTN